MTLAPTSAGWGHGPWGVHVGGFGEGPWPTLDYTPGFPHTTERAYAVEVLPFDDGSELRVLQAEDPAHTIEWTSLPNDPTWLGTVTSWWVAAEGRVGRFIARDHHAAVDYVVRFRDETIGRTRGPALRTQVQTLPFQAERAVTYDDAVLVDRPVAYWPLREVTGVHSATEIVNGFHLRFTTSGLTPGVAGPLLPVAAESLAAMRFVGSAALQAGNLPTLDVGTASMTWEMWFRTSTATVNGQWMYQRDTLALGNGFYVYVNGSGGIQGRLHAITFGSVTSRHNDGQWHHLVCRAVRSGTGAHYIDAWIDRDVAVMSFSLAGLSGTNITTTFGTYVGNDGIIFVSGFQGDLAAVAVYPHDLSLARIAAHYAAGVRWRA